MAGKQGIDIDVMVTSRKINITVSRTVEINKGWFKFEYSESRIVPIKTIEKEKKKLWNDCITEVDDQIEELKKFLGVK